MAKLILTHEVTGLGTAGDVVDVKDGYARNYLLPRNLATPWTKGGQKQIDQITAARRKRAIESIEDARAVRDSLQAKSFAVKVNAGPSGRLFGAVTTTDIAEAIHAAGGQQVDRRKIEIGQPIKSLGSYQVQVRLHADVSATVDLNVVPGA
ncbi:50S ribosomal protein L9 [Ruania alkalisoli]|uniref:Large ribosomal subunit protein bL9 n=1 Tax=Ruania alkalisoli TaxID=2779775 RepID=A0A7M1SUJ2_9MICO|nr:50S ribosomal protein L9 [Ruania alkalisoli]QOR70727.1 50S ribosomal protein L9 [Ruania alkalisoli]